MTAIFPVRNTSSICLFAAQEDGPAGICICRLCRALGSGQTQQPDRLITQVSRRATYGRVAVLRLASLLSLSAVAVAVGRSPMCARRPTVCRVVAPEGVFASFPCRLQRVNRSFSRFVLELFARFCMQKFSDGTFCPRPIHLALSTPKVCTAKCMLQNGGVQCIVFIAYQYGLRCHKIQICITNIQ